MAALLKRILPCGQGILIATKCGSVVNTRRQIKNWVAPTLHEFYKRKKLMGEVKPIPRSHFVNWNYKTELFAFGARLNEPFKEETLRVAFTHPSYIEQEIKKRKDAGVPDDQVSLQITDNVKLIEIGEKVMNDYIKPFLRVGFPYLPEEGIVAIEKYLTSVEVLSHVAFNLGVKDLILSEDYPPEEQTKANTLKAIIGALATDSDRQRTEIFIQDFLITQLIGKDVNGMWSIVDPMGVLVKILEREGRGPPEPRLIRESGRNTILAIYQIAIYSDKKFLGMSPGETVEVAEEEAARDSLRRIFGTTEKQPPLPFGSRGREIKIQHEPNLLLNEWTREKAKQKTQQDKQQHLLEDKISVKNLI